MRRTAWILAALGLAGSAFRLSAAENLLGGTKARRLAPATAVRTSEVRTVAAASDAKSPTAETKNYYEDLFGAPPIRDEAAPAKQSANSGGLKSARDLRAEFGGDRTGDASGQDPSAPATRPTSRALRLGAAAPDQNPFAAAAAASARPKPAPQELAPSPADIDSGDAPATREAFTRSRPATPAEDPLSRTVSARRPSNPLSDPAAAGHKPSLTDAIPTAVSSAASGAVSSPALGSDESLPHLDFDGSAAADTAPATRRPLREILPQPKTEPALEAPAPANDARRSAGAAEIEPARYRAPVNHPVAAPAVAPEPRAASSSRSLGVTAEWAKRTEIVIGRECVCELIVRNQTEGDVSDVEVEALLPANVDLIGTEPASSSTAPNPVWKLSTLAAGASQTITIRMVPRARGSIDAKASVRFSNAASKTFSVAEPMLAVELTGPTEVVVGEPASQTVTIRNPGTGIATNVKVEAHIPGGLEHSRGGHLMMDLGSLNPGESRPVRLALAAVAGGRQVVEVNVQADGDLVQSASAEVLVIAPQLRAEIQGPSLRYIGRQAAFTLSVSNDGAAGTDNVRVMEKIPDGFEFVSCDKGGRFDSGTGLLNWFVGPLDHGESAEAHVILKASAVGSYTHFVRATSERGVVSDAQATTTVAGSPALVMSVKDLDDPVETGVETAYEIRVSNEGSAAAEHVALSCELPQGASFISATGPVSFDVRGQNIEFRPVAGIAPGEGATYQVFIRGDVAGNLRFRTRLTSDSVQEPLVSEELTKFYGE